jgi:glyoxylate reductase
MGRTIAVTSRLPGRAEDMLSERFEMRVHDGASLVDETELARFFGAADAAVTLLANPVTASVLAACPELKVVANVAVGYDNIDLDAAAERGVWVSNTPDVLTEATADLTWALILAVTRRVVEADAFLRAGRYQGWALDLLLGSSLQGRTLGIVGFGRIGRAVARRAEGFGMCVVCSDNVPPDGADVLPLDDLIASSDVVSLHCPHNARTHHLIDRRRLGLFRSNAVLINTARGPLVDEEALVNALEEGRLGGAGLDVFENEPAVHSGLLDRTDVVLLPHIGSATVQTRAAMAELAAENVLAVLEGREPPTAVVKGK